jgi:hypothetical protein
MPRRLVLLLMLGLSLAASAAAQTSTYSADKITAGATTFGTGPLRVVGLGTGAGTNCVAVDGSGDITKTSGACGTVTSVALTAPSELSVSGSPVTTSGTLGLTWAAVAANSVFQRASGSGVPSFSTSLTLAGDLGINGGNLTSTGALAIQPTGNLTEDPTGDVILGPDGADVLPDSGYRVNLGALTNKYLTLHAAELWVEMLVAQNTIATIGGRILVGPTTTLTVDLGSGVGDTTITVKHNEMASGDRVVLQANGALEWMAITSAPGGSAGAYTYSVTRDLDGSGRNAWTAGDAVFNSGTTADGYIDLYSVAGLLPGSTAGPTIVGNVRTGTTYSDVSPRWAVGNLNGLYGYGATTYGFAAGVPTGTHVTVDATNGFRIRSNTTDKLVADASGNLTLAGALNVTGSGSFSAGHATLNSAGIKISPTTVGSEDRAYGFTSALGVLGTQAYTDDSTYNIIYLKATATTTAAVQSILGVANATGDTYIAATQGSTADGAAIYLMTTGYTYAAADRIDLDANNSSHGVWIVDSGSGSTSYANLYMTDASTDYLNIVVNATTSTIGLVVDDDNQVGIGTTTPAYALDIAGSTAQIKPSAGTNAALIVNASSSAYGYVRLGDEANSQYWDVAVYDDGTNELEFRYAGGGPHAWFDTTGNLNTPGVRLTNWSNTQGQGYACANVDGNGDGYITYQTGVSCVASTRRAKHDIRPLDVRGVDAILDLTPVTYRMNFEGDTGPYYVGAIAEEAAALGLEWLVVRDDDGLPRSFLYDRVPLYLIPVVRQQRDEIAELKARVAALEGRP